MLSMRRKATSLAALLIALLPAAACDDDDPTGPPELGTPTNLSVTPTGATSLRVTWDAVSGASGYAIERATGATGGSFDEVGTASTTEYEDTDLDAANVYRYRVIATAGSTRSLPSNASPAVGPAEIVRIVTDNIASDETWHADTTYVLSGFIQVGNGATLTIEAGTKIIGDFEIPGSSLFILRGAKIMAEGTAERPIVFTSERPVGERQPGDWGGLIIIGNGIISRTGETIIEGTGTSAANPNQNYGGGTDNEDNSGVLRYVRIEFAGFPVRENEELNSLTMAAVGRGTTIEYVQVLLGLDDSFEWFGGAVDAKYLVSYESGDDHLDMSEGYIGRVQYAIVFQSIQPEARAGLAGGVATDPQGIENDGCWASNCNAGDSNRSASEPYTVPVIANFTVIGPRGAWETPSGEVGMMLRRGTGGLYVNGVVAGYTRAGVSYRGVQTNQRENQGLLALRNILFAENAVTFQPLNPGEPDVEAQRFVMDLEANSLEESDISTADLFVNIEPDEGGANLDFAPAPGSPLANGGLDDFSGLPAALRDAAGTLVEPTSFRGAADPNGEKWWQGWTYWNRF